jgi:hypothetical protein
VIDGGFRDLLETQKEKLQRLSLPGRE